jgi:hypothetical protein
MKIIITESKMENMIKEYISNSKLYIEPYLKHILNINPISQGWGFLF